MSEVKQAAPASVTRREQTKYLPPSDLQLAEQVRQVWAARTAQGVTSADLAEPSFWAHHAVKFRPLDKIEVRAADGTFYAELIVLDCSRTWARTKQLFAVQLTTGDVSLTQASEAEAQKVRAQYKVQHRGPRGWSVIRTADKTVEREELGTQDAAVEWLDAFVKYRLGKGPQPDGIQE